MKTLLKLMNLPPSMYDGVCKTSDGFYMGKGVGDIGYNTFLGRPAPPHAGPGRNHTLAVWSQLSSSERQAVLVLAAKPPDGSPIDLHADFGVPTINAGD